MDTLIETPEAEPMSYEQTLNYTQNIRRKFINKLCEHSIPTDPETANLLLKGLKDMDHTAIGDRKNRIDQEGVNSSKDIADAMAQFVRTQNNKNPFMRNPDGSVTELTPVIPKVDESKLGDYEPVPGEADIGVIAETSEEFIGRMKDRSEQD